jgi:hypothetical protein
MMNRILFVILAVLLILSIFTTSCGPFGPCLNYWAPIEDVGIWADECMPAEYLEYFLYVVYGFSSCDDSSYYELKYDIEIWNRTCHPECPVDRYATYNISLGCSFVPGVNYTVKVNDVTLTFVAGIMIYLAPIHDVEIWANNSSPRQYFADVMSGEPSICDHFNSYNVTRTSNTTIIADIFNLSCGTGCPDEYSYVENTIPLGSDFVSGGNYTVVVNNVTETFVA